MSKRKRIYKASKRFVRKIKNDVEILVSFSLIHGMIYYIFLKKIFANKDIDAKDHERFHRERNKFDD